MFASRLAVTVFAPLIVLSLTAPVGASQSSRHLLIIRVFDPAGDPVPNARVGASTRDSRMRSSGRTNDVGTLQLDALAADYVVEVSAPGFAAVTRIIAVNAPRTTVDVRLPIAALTEHVIVTASGDQQAALEVSKAVAVVDRAEIDARQEFSVADALRTTPGVTIQQLGAPGAFTSIKLRGLREQDTAVLIDGVRFRDAASPQGDAAAFIGELYVTHIDRIEVLRGSGSSLYGSHAVGGAVNVITREGGGPSTGEVSAEGGSLGFRRITAHAGGSARNERLRYSAGVAHTRTTGLDADDDARNTSGQARGDMHVSAAALVTLRAYVSDASSAINESPAAIGPLPSSGFVPAVPLVTFTPSANDPDNRRDSTFASTLIRFQHRPVTRFGYTTSFHRLATTRVFLDGPQGTAFEPIGATWSDLEGRVNTFESRADLEWSADQTTTAAYELERERYESRAVPVSASMAWRADMTQDSHALSLQQQMRFEALQLAVGFRAQRFSMHRPKFEPSDRAPFSATAFTAPPSAATADVSASRWLQTTGTKLRGHVGNGYRAPAMFERAGASFGSRGYTVYGDPRLEPERSIAVDAGVDQIFAGGRLQTTATWFRTRLLRVIAFESVDPAADPFGRRSGYRTTDGRTAGGIELGARIRPAASHQMNVSYTFVDAPAPAGNRDGLPRAAAVPAHQFSVLVLQRIAQDFQLSFELEAAGDHYGTLFDPVTFGARAYRFDSIVRADVAAIYTRSLGGRTQLRLHTTIGNLFARRQFVQGFATPDRMARAGLSVTF
jgi:vitamin B12 transporter